MYVVPKGIRRWLAKHHRWLPYAGASLALVTVFVREDLRERWNRYAEAIDLAQYVFSVKQDLSTVKRGVIARDAKTPELDNDEFFYRRQDELFASDLESSMQNIELLVDKLPSERDVTAKMATFKKEVEEGKQELDNAILASPAFASLNGSTPKNAENKWHYRSSKASFAPNADKSATPSTRRYDELFTSFSALDWDLIDFNKSVLARAEEVKRQNESLAEIALGTILILGVTGFVLGVLSKFYGDEKIEFEA